MQSLAEVIVLFCFDLSCRSINNILDHRSTMKTQHQSIDIPNLKKEPMTVMKVGNSTRMIMDMSEM